ncbi:MAG: cell division protein FtsQ/DivIB [Acidimicrobiales bacterium]
MTDPRIHERRVDVARERGRRRRRRLVLALGAASLATGGLLIVHTGLFGARTVRVLGSRHTPRSTILAAAHLQGSPPLIDVSPAIVSRRLERLPWVAAAAVTISWPSTVTIRVTERVPVAAVALAGKGGPVALCDGSGHVLEDLAARPPSLPLVRTSAPVGRPGSTLGRRGAELTAVAAGLPESMVAETSAIYADAGGTRLVLDDGIVAEVGVATQLRQKFVSLATVLAHGGLEGVRVVDLRDPEAPVLLR